MLRVMQLYLVRHAAVVVRADQPSEQWHLSPEGRAAAEALAGDDGWAALARLYSSPEPKAIATAQRIAMRNALPLSIEPALHEVERPWTEGDYRELARSYLRGEPVEGWEPYGGATARIRRAIEAIVSRHGEADVGVISHGLILSVYLADLLGLDGPAAIELWDSIGLPNYAIVDLKARKLIRPFGASFDLTAGRHNG
jgi:broad specificity phosphatase PhoE